MLLNPFNEFPLHCDEQKHIGVTQRVVSNRRRKKKERRRRFPYEATSLSAIIEISFIADANRPGKQAERERERRRRRSHRR